MCSCSPRFFTITLDLANECNNNTVKQNSGIAFTICSIKVSNNFGERLPNGNPTPIVITSVTLIDIISVCAVIKVDDQYINLNFITGSSFGLESIASSLSLEIGISNQLNLFPSTAVLFMIVQNASN